MFAGSHSIQVWDETQGVSIAVLVLYPTAVPSKEVRFGPYPFDVSPDSPLAEGTFPLVVVSHGTGGSHLLYRTIAVPLARNGYVVALVEHPGNNRNDNRLDGTLENLVNRPRHLRLAIDAVVSDPRLGPSGLADRVAVVGHSLGAYTALALAGGRPWSESRQPIEVESDRRVRALVLMAPAAGWFLHPDSLRAVSVPILILVAEHDPYTPRWNAEAVREGVPDPHRVDIRVIENGGHFSFLSPFPPQMKSPGFLPSTDPEGFDREAFHQRLPGEVVEFLDGVLKSETVDSTGGL